MICIVVSQGRYTHIFQAYYKLRTIEKSIKTTCISNLKLKEFIHHLTVNNIELYVQCNINDRNVF